MFARIINISENKDTFLVLDENVSTGTVYSKNGFCMGDFIKCEIRFLDDDYENHDSYEIISYEKVCANDVLPLFKREMLLDKEVIEGAMMEI